VRRLVWVAGALAGLVVLLLVYGAIELRSLDSPEFHKTLLEQARGTLGTNLRVERMTLSIFSGVSLRGVVIDNPPPFKGPFVSAQSFVLRYRLWPLLAGRLDVQQLAIEEPSINLEMDARGRFNYELLKPLAAPGAASRTSSSSALTLLLSKLSVDRGQLSLRDQSGPPLMRAEGFGLASGFEVGAAGLSGSGTVRLSTLDLGDALFVRDVEAPLKAGAGRATLGPVRGRVADGRLAGSLALRLGGGFQYGADVQVDGARVETLLKEAKAAPSLAGSLKATAHFDGTAGLPTLSGKGNASVGDCRAGSLPLLKLLSSVLQVPELADPRFDQCLLEFSLARSRLETAVLSMKGPSVDLGGHGSVMLETGALDHAMTLALRQALVDKISAREVRAAFTPRGDGFAKVDFKVSGTLASPKVDLLSRIGEKALTEAAKGKLKKLIN